MDQDEFNDFQTSSPPAQPEHPPPPSDTPQLFAYHQQTAQPTVEPQPVGELVSSYSLDNNAPSQQAYEFDSIDWEGSAWPSLGKMESDHMGTLEQQVPDFSKNNSQGEVQSQSNHYPGQYAFNREHKEAKQNYSNSATQHSNLFEDFDFGMTSKPHHESRNHSPESLPEKNEPVSPRKVQQERSQTHQKGSRQDSNRLDKKQDDEQDEFNDFGTAEARKQSQDFEYQQAVQPEQQIHTQEPHNQVVQTQKDYYSEPDHNQAEEKQKPEDDKDFVQYQVSQPAQEFHNYEYKHQQPAQKHEQAPKEEEDDDQFGDFQQTVQTTEETHINGTSSPNQAEYASEVVSPYQQPANQSNEVKIDPSKAPYDMEVTSRQQQLQKFVDSLPDYGFLLARAFNTL